MFKTPHEARPVWKTACCWCYRLLPDTLSANLSVILKNSAFSSLRKLYGLLTSRLSGGDPLLSYPGRACNIAVM